MFVGRIAEIQQLESCLSRRRPSISVVYGRRRIGKSALIGKALEGHQALFFEGLENRPTRAQLDNFVFQLGHQTGNGPRRPRVTRWTEALMLLEPILKERPACVVLDEFQWMANNRHELVAELKMVWDQYLARIPGVSLILCGSIASFMTSMVVRSSALYGRTDLVIHLGPFTLAETSAMLEGRGWDEIVTAQLYSGGVPKYLELFADAPSVQLAMEELSFSPNGYLFDEYERIFTSHFGRNPDYRKIVEALASHPYGLFRKQLAENAGLKLGGRLSDHLKELELAGFISSTLPIDKMPPSRLIKYNLSDAYLRFYFAFIVPRKKKIQSVTAGQLFARLTHSGAYYAWRGQAFEHLCAAHAMVIADLLGFSGIDFNVGPYFRPPRRGVEGIQVDLLFDRTDDVLTLCEMKYGRTTIGRSVIKQMERKAEILRQRFGTRTIQRVLIVHGDVTQNLVNSGYLYRIVDSRELLQPLH